MLAWARCHMSCVSASPLAVHWISQIMEWIVCQWAVKHFSCLCNYAYFIPLGWLTAYAQELQGGIPTCVSASYENSQDFNKTRGGNSYAGSRQGCINWGGKSSSLLRLGDTVQLGSLLKGTHSAIISFPISKSVGANIFVNWLSQTLVYSHFYDNFLKHLMAEWPVSATSLSSPPPLLPSNNRWRHIFICCVFKKPHVYRCFLVML